MASSLACGLAALGLSLDAEQLHWQASVRLLDDALGARVEGERVVLHLPREKSDADRQLLLRDAEVSAAEVLEFLGAADSKPARVDVFLFRSAEEKRRLIGAADTSFTKPWLRQIHTNDAAAPHPIVRHELAHALAADYARGPFGVPGRLWGAVPDMAFIEGLAVAADWPANEATVDQETAALLKLGKLPDLVRLFAPGRFYGEAGPSAYASAGSLVRFLWRTKGAAAVRAAYGAPEGLASLGPLDALASAHAAALQTVHVPDTVLALSALRFQQPSILRRRCPHEVAELQRTAGEAAQRGDAAGAAQLFAKCIDLEPDDPGLLLAEERALKRAGDDAGAAKAAQAALAHPKLSTAQRAQLLTEAGDLALRKGDTAAAAARWQEASALPQTEAQARSLAVRRWMLADPLRFPAIRRLLLDADNGPEAWVLLRDLDLALPGEGLPAYLLGRQAQGRGAWEMCGRFVTDSLTRSLPGAPFEEEARRIRALCAARAGDVAGARAAYAEVLKSQSEARRLEAERALRRL
jgi:Flp pilus assembly protein TadD